jgi:hypothetical protein
MKRAILLVRSQKLDPRALDEGPMTKKWQIEVKPTWHLLWKENQLVRTKEQNLEGIHDFKNQEYC